MDLRGDLDRFLEEAGEDAILRRMVSGAPVDVTVRITKRSLRLSGAVSMMESGTAQDEIRVVTSMTKIEAAGWPGTSDTGTSPFGVPANLPRRGDQLIVNGRLYRIESSHPVSVQNNVIRVVLMALGGASGA